jgi:hypothetical protein
MFVFQPAGDPLYAAGHFSPIADQRFPNSRFSAGEIDLLGLGLQQV